MDPHDVDPSDEQRALRAAQDGDARAFGLIVRRYQHQAYRSALGILGNHDDAWDLSQDAFVRAYRQLDRFQVDRPFYPWFYRLLRNLCLNHIRWKKRRREDSIDVLEERGGFLEAGPDADPERATEAALMGEAIAAALRRLRPAAREILVLRELRDLSYAEIAELLDIPRGTVMSRLHHARKALREELAPYYSEAVS